MKAVLKFLVIGTGLLLIGLTLIALLLGSRVEGFARAGLEQSLSRGLGVPVTIDRLAAAPIQEAVIVEGLHIGMAEGFGDGDMLYCPRILVSVHTRSLLTERPAVRLIRVEAPVLTVRHSLGNGVNIVPMLQPVASDPDEGDPPTGSGFIIERIEVTEGTLRTATNAAPVASEVPIPATELSDIAVDGPLNALNGLRVVMRQVFGHQLTGQGKLKPLLDNVGESFRSLLDAVRETP